MMQQSRITTRITPLPDELASAQAKLVYLYLDATGGATLEDLKETLSMQKIAILSVIGSLTKQDMVDCNGDQYVLSN